MANFNGKKIKYKLIMQIGLCVGVMVGVSNIFGIGCSSGNFKAAGYGEQSSSSSDGGGGSLGGGGGSGGSTRILSGVKTAGVPILSQSYATLVGALQIATPSAASRTEYTNQLTNLSESGQPASIGPAFAVAMTGLSAQVCLDKVTAELNLAAAQKNIFTGFNLAAAPANNVTDATIKDVVNRLARALWQRDETPAELTILSNGVKESMNADAGNNANETQEAALFLCTAMAVAQSGIEL